MVDVLMTFNVYSSNVTDFLLIEFDYDILDYLNFNIVSVPSQNDNITVFYGVNFVKTKKLIFLIYFVKHCVLFEE